MSDHETVHTTFTLERVYPAPPAAVFAAWADRRTKARWMAGSADADLELDFRVGGVEVARGRAEGGPALTFTSHFHDVVDDERIVYSSTMHAEGRGITTVSVTSVELEPATGEQGGGTRLVLTQQGTATQLDALGVVLA